MTTRLKAEVVILGDGCAALFAAARAMAEGLSVALVNPLPGFGIADLRPVDGLSLWGAAFRAGGDDTSFSNLWDELNQRLREALPVSLDEAGLERGEQWSILSSVPVHRANTAAKEQEFFRLERKPWSAGQVRLVNPEFIDMKFKGMGLRLSAVASVEGALVRNHALWWDAPRIGKALSEFAMQKSLDGHCTRLVNAEVTGRVGRRLFVSCGRDEITLEYEKALLVMMTGDVLPHLKEIVRGEDESPWIQGLRKRRRERHAVWFQGRGQREEEGMPADGLWFDLGDVAYRWRGDQGAASWRTRAGPDGLDTVVDEGLRLCGGALKRTTRGFCLEWEWKTPQWRQTNYDTHWATAFEGDLWATMELLWNSPL